MPQRYQDWAMRLSMFVCTLFMGSMAVVAFKYFIRLTNSGQITPAMQIPMSWAFLAVPVGCAFMCIHFLIELLLPKEADNG